ncbi:wax ester/triacylglycerol synthase family O-acyltransferase [Williamsia serinedens]|uniref:Wax ester synthase-like Acyl-CoA acyltransferase domain-containing protein n=1 Tax=Williamsia serinedens TaxID=391736 RepID=A0ABT1H1Q7_9NOCA|nr:wax ester/triacylglycerol synthase family O-acyltransferase [Williamsia serinedens]MCP2161158.1 Wax ester synthase-like Acyl-CoA acyltransferase domain-containing protein [Williamsia serinedens]
MPSVPGRLAPADARALWMSSVIPSDQFLLYAFDDGGRPADDLVEQVLVRARGIGDLTVRIVDTPGHLDYPRWVTTAIHRDDAVRVHDVPDWRTCLGVLGRAVADQVDTRRLPWRVHLMPRVTGVPGAGDDSATVAVLQISHALADGTLASAIARELWSDDRARHPRRRGPVGSIPAPVVAAAGLARLPVQGATLVRRGIVAHRAHRERESDELAGRLPPRRPGVPRATINVAPDDRRDLRVVLTDSDRLRAVGGTVTVGALTVIGAALAAHLEVAALRAEVLVASAGERRARNHFRTVGVDLAVDEPDPGRRAARIADDLADASRRGMHPAAAAEAAAMAAVPAALVAWGVRSFDAHAVPETVSGNTVVSSVNRGDDDLVFGGGRVLFTAGFPALSPLQTVTHGVHGIGRRVALSVCSSPTGLAAPDAYADRLAAAVR